MTAPPPLLELEHATVVLGQTTVFSDLCLVLPQGVGTAVLGPNGSGKTTLLRLLTRELYPTWSPRTRMRVLGRERWNVFELRGQMGLVSHELQLRHLSLPERSGPNGLDVALSGFHSSVGLWPHQQVSEEQERRALEVLDRLGARHLAATGIAAMSVGEQRRCLLARALVHDPHTLVLDEPTAGLDLRAGFELLALLRALAQRGRTLVLVTHHLGEIPPEVSHVVLLKRGQVVAEGRKADVLTSASLSDLYEISLQVVEVGGYFSVLPASRGDPDRDSLGRITAWRPGEHRGRTDPGS